MEDLTLVEEVITMEVVVVEVTGEATITDQTLVGVMEDGIMEITGVIMVVIIGVIVADLTQMEVGTVATMEVIGVIMVDLTPTLGVIMVTVIAGMEEVTADQIPIIMEVLVVTLVTMEVTMEAAIVADLTLMEVGEENRLQKKKVLMLE